MEERGAWINFEQDPDQVRVPPPPSLLQAGIAPAAVRLYDELDTLLGKSGGDEERKKTGFSFAGLFAGAAEKAIPLAFSQRGRIDSLVARVGKGCMLVTTYEGARGVAAAEEAAATAVFLSEGATDAGEGPAKHWWEHRYDISFKQSQVVAHGAFVDTIEVAAPWSRLLALYQSMRKALLAHVLVMAHFSHAYTDGCSIYFTIIGYAPTDLEKVAIYDKAWSAALDACRAQGATISHHHGVGRHKVDAFKKERGAAGMRAHRRPALVAGVASRAVPCRPREAGSTRMRLSIQPARCEPNPPRNPIQYPACELLNAGVRTTPRSMAAPTCA